MKRSAENPNLNSLVNVLRRERGRLIEKLQYGSAIYLSDKIIAIKGMNAKDGLILAHCIYLSKQYHRAANIIQRNRLHEKDVQCFCLFVKCLMKIKKYKEALNYIGTYFKTKFEEKWKVPLLVLKSHCHEAIDNRVDAKDSLFQALELNFLCYEAFYNITHHHMTSKSEELELLCKMSEKSRTERTKIIRNIMTDFMIFFYYIQLKKYDKPDKLVVKEPFDIFANNVDYLIALAERHFYNFELIPALEITNSINEKYPYNFQCLEIHISCLLGLERSIELFKLSQNLIDLYPENEISWFALGCYYHLIKKKELSRRYLLKAVTLNNIFAPAWLLYGQSFSEDGEHDQVMAAYFKASHLMPGCHLPLLYIGVEYVRTDNHRLGEKFIMKALSIAPEDPLVLHELSVTAFHSKELLKADRFLRGALKAIKYPEIKDDNEFQQYPIQYEPLFNNMGHILRKLDRNYEAIEFFKRSLALSPGNPSTYLSIGLLYCIIGEFPEALGYLDYAYGFKMYKRDETRLLLEDTLKYYPESFELDLPDLDFLIESKLPTWSDSEMKAKMEYARNLKSELSNKEKNNENSGEFRHGNYHGLNPLMEISLTETQTGVPLFPGEKIDNDINGREVSYLCPYEGEIRGRLYLTNYKLCFMKEDEPSKPKFIYVPLSTINKIEKFGGANTKGINAYGINIICKDVRTLKFAHSPENHSRRDVFEKLKQYAFPLTYPSNKKLFCFEFKATYPVDGWSVYEPTAEFRRLHLPNESWRITKINDKYKLCDTYPSLLVVPQAATEQDLHAVAAFRSRARLPVLSWIHPESQASIVRCSQPLTGISGQRSSEDEKYIQMIMYANAQSHKIFIMDARPQTNAMANRTRGGGLENEHLYNSAEIQFLGIASIHPMRESQRKLTELCYAGNVDDSLFMIELEKSQWLKHIQVILSGAVRIVDKIEYQKTSVVVHCSDGWDRTSQLTSLAMLMLDPYYRTLLGFQVLIEKEWLSFGHKFAQRLGHGEDKSSDDNRSPVFLQWLDCVWQMMRQFPTAFEFNETLLLVIADHMYSCLFGTFLANSECIRKRDQIPTKTKSLWSMVNSYREEFLNPGYTAAPAPYSISLSAPRDYVILPRCAAPFIQLWKSYFCRWNERISPQSIDQIRLRNKELLAMRTSLEKKVEEMQKQLQNKYSRQSNAASNTHNSSGPSSPSNSQLTNTNPNARVVNV